MNDAHKSKCIFSHEDRTHIQELLREASPNASLTLLEKMTHEDSLKRMMHDLECHAQQVILDWNRLRGGKAKQELDQQRAEERAKLKKVKEFDKFLRTAQEQLTGRFAPLLDKHDAQLKQGVIEILSKLEAASTAARQRHKVLPRRAKSESSIAKDLLKDFLEVAMVIWCQATRKRPTRGITPNDREPSGPCSRFLSSASRPLVARLNANSSVLPISWPGLYKRLDDLQPELIPDLTKVFLE